MKFTVFPLMLGMTLNGSIVLAVYMKTGADGHLMVIFAVNAPIRLARIVSSGTGR